MKGMEPRFPVGDDTQWFVFSDDRQTGPFVTSDLAGRLNSGDLAEDCYVWAQGFTDWIPAREVPGLDAYRMDLRSFAQAEFLDTLNDSMKLPEADFVSDQKSAQSDEASDINTWAARQAVVNEKLAAAEAIVKNGAVPIGTQSKKPTSFFQQHKYKTAILGCLLIWAMASLGLKRFERFTPIDQLNLSSADANALREAATKSKILFGPAAEVVLASAADEYPRFAVATNLQDGEKIEIRVDGIAGKMLDRNRYARKSTLTVKNGFVLTDRLLEIDGKPFRAGLFQVSIKNINSDTQLAKKTFLLGKVPNGDFEAALVQYQQVLKEQIQVEQLELQQLFQTTSEVFKDFSTWFSKSEFKPGLEKEWATRSRKFQALDAQLKSMEQQWTSEPMMSQIYYLDAFKSMSELIRSIRMGHAAIERYVLSSDSATRAANREAIAQAWLKAQSATDSLTKQIADFRR